MKMVVIKLFKTKIWQIRYFNGMSVLFLLWSFKCEEKKWKLQPNVLQLRKIHSLTPAISRSSFPVLVYLPENWKMFIWCVNCSLVFLRVLPPNNQRVTTGEEYPTKATDITKVVHHSIRKPQTCIYVEHLLPETWLNNITSFCKL